MREPSFSPRPTRVIRFDHGDRRGEVRVFYGITARPEDSGFPSLKGWKAERRAGVGFPTIKCTVESERPGYASNLGWIQWVTEDFHGDRESVQVVDRAPSMMDLDLPFAVVAYSPSFFDAPAYNSLPRIDWTARLFLATLPMMDRREPIHPLCGLVWGYRIERRGGAVTPLPLRAASRQDWQTVRNELASRHASWRFAARYEPGPERRRRRPQVRGPSRGQVAISGRRR